MIPQKALMSLLCLVPVVSFAQHYTGPAVDINHIKTPPAKYKYCDRYINKTAKEFRACELGLSEAERMAIRYGGGHGKLQGFLTGFTWGLYDQSQLTRDDEQSRKEGALALNSGSIGQSIEKGVKEGVQQAKSHGKPRGEQDARQVFINAINNPNANIEASIIVPQVNYNGISNAYEKYVGAVPTEREIIEQDIDLYKLPVEFSSDAIYLGELRPLTIWDYFSYRGVYRFEKETWYSPAKAWDIWLNVLQLDTKADYLNLNVDPVTDENGVAIDLQKIFNDAFVNTYGHYINYHFSSNFHSQLAIGQVSGENIGSQVGKRIAYTNGLVDAYNTKFQESSKKHYHEAYAQAYAQGYQEVYDYHQNNPVLEVQIVDIIGEVDNGVIEPSEKVSFVLEVTNLGNIDTQIDITSNGDIESSEVDSAHIEALTSKQITTKLMATIDSRLDTSSIANLGVEIRGKNNSSANAGTNQKVNNVVELASLDQVIAPSSGSGQVNVMVENKSTLETPGAISAQLIINGKEVEKVSAGKIQAGSIKAISLNFSKMDPLAIITSKLNAEVVLSMGGVEIEEYQFEVKSADRTQDLVSYLADILTNTALIPMGQSKNSRLDKVTQIVLEKNALEVQDINRSSNLYKHEPSRTIPGMLALKAQSASNSETRVHYHNMAVKMWKEKKAFGFFKGGKRKKYKKLLDRMTINGKVKKAKLK